MKDNSLSLNKEIYFEFPMLTSKLNQSFRVEGKNECLKQFNTVTTNTVVPCSDGRFIFRN